MNINIFRLIEISKKKEENKIQINSLAFIFIQKNSVPPPKPHLSLSLSLLQMVSCLRVCIYKHIPIKQQIPHFAYLKNTIFTLKL